MTNEQIVIELRDAQERLSRSLTVIEACTESFEMAARHRHETLRTALGTIRSVEDIVSRIKKAIEAEQKQEDKF